MLNLSVKRLIMRFSRVIWQLLLPSLKSNVSQEKRCSDLLSILTSCNRFFITYFARCFVGLQDTFTSKGISTALTVIYRIVLVLFFFAHFFGSFTFCFSSFTERLALYFSLYNYTLPLF